MKHTDARDILRRLEAGQDLHTAIKAAIDALRDVGDCLDCGVLDSEQHGRLAKAAHATWLESYDASEALEGELDKLREELVAVVVEVTA